MEQAAALAQVLAQVKRNIDELSPILCKAAAYVAVLSPSDDSVDEGQCARAAGARGEKR